MFLVSDISNIPIFGLLKYICILTDDKILAFFLLLKTINSHEYFQVSCVKKIEVII